MIHLAAVTSPDLLQHLHSLARAGGGGSSSGGGSGGGGGLIIAIGYFASYYSTNWAVLKGRTILGCVLGSIAGVVVTVLMASLIGYAAFWVFIGACAGVYGGVKSWHASVRARLKKSKQQVAFAAQVDPAWDEAKLDARFKEVFSMFQADWSAFNLPRMQTYMTPRYYAHNYYMLKALDQLKRQNIVGNPVLHEAFVYEMRDNLDNNTDYVVAYIRAEARDQLIDRTTGQAIYTDARPFQEFWRFERSGNVWQLADIRQATENSLLRDTSLEAFAAKSGMFFSPDWGWLLLPQRGELFGKANFKKSDINNHVIGEWQGLLVQIYTYIPVKSNNAPTNYLIGQISLPKSYGGIIIKRRSRWNFFSVKPRGYNNIRFEWPDFNKRYNVYATDVDQVTSFEILNPAFMAELHDMALPINIEVVDNVVYFYCRASEPTRRYEDMLKVLARAWRELKM